MLAEAGRSALTRASSSSTCAKACSSTPDASSPATTSSTTSCGPQGSKVGVGQFGELQRSWFTSVDTPDKYTAIVHIRSPRPAIFDLLEFLNIVDKDTIEGPDAQTKIVGTGPFKFVEWVQGDHMTLAKNKNYWQSGRPYIDEWRVLIVPDSQAMHHAVRGRCDWISWHLAPVATSVRLQADREYQVIATSARRPISTASSSTRRTRRSTTSWFARRSITPSIASASSIPRSAARWSPSTCRGRPDRQHPNQPRTTSIPSISEVARVAGAGRRLELGGRGNIVRLPRRHGHRAGADLSGRTWRRSASS